MLLLHQLVLELIMVIYQLPLNTWHHLRHQLVDSGLVVMFLLLILQLILLIFQLFQQQEIQ